jgi:hypothetical protein
MARYMVLTLYLLGRVNVLPIRYLVDPSFMRRYGGISHNLSSKNWNHGRVVLSHALIDV